MTTAEREEAFGSTTVPARYRAGLEVDVSADVADVIEDILSACNGRIAYTGAGYRVQVGDPQPAVATLTDADILSTAQQSFAPFLPLAETVNSVSATYPEPEEGWQQQDAPALIVTDYEDEERGRRLPTTVDLPAVPYREQVQRLMSAALAEARRARRHSVTLPARFWSLLPGDFLDWTSERNGYDAKRFRVDGVVDLPNGDIRVDLTEVEPSDYSWSAQTDYTPLARGSVTGQPVGAASVTGFALAPASVPDGTGTARRPAILLTWADPGDGGVDAVRWQVRLPDGTAVSAGRTPDVELLGHYVVEGVLPGQAYEVRARFDAPGRPTPWTGWTSVTAPDVRLTQDDLADELSGKVDEAFERHDAVLEDATGTVGALREIVDDHETDRLIAITGNRVHIAAENVVRADVVATARTDFESADNALQVNIDAIDTALAAARTDFESADNALQVNIDAIQAQINDLNSLPAWDSTTTFDIDDQVTHEGSMYVALQPSTNVEPPDAAYWEKVGEYASLADAVIANSTSIGDLEADVTTLTSSVENNYYTIAETDSAISAATTTLKSDIEDPAGSSIGADLANNYYTSAETDSAIAAEITTLKSEIEDPNGTSVAADLENNYYTSVEADSAISAATSALKAEIEDPAGSSLGALLESDHYTIAEADSAIAAANTALRAEIEDPNGTSLGATLEAGYYTIAEADSAISAATSALKSEIEDPAGTSVAADLAQNHYTSAETDSAIATEISALKSEIEDPDGTSVGAGPDGELLHERGG